MPNKFQLTFLSTFVLVFTSLFLVSRFLNAKLKEAGYDISKLILIGIEDKDVDSTPGETPADALKAAVISKFGVLEKLGDTMSFSTLLALALAVVTSAFVYWQFSSSSEYRASLPRKHITHAYPSSLTNRTQAST